MRELILTAFALMVAATQAVAQQSQKPNVVFILADNVGYGDLGPYGGGELRGAPTPRIDQLAREGLRLTQFLVEPACSPSRAALMTGRYSIREGLSLILVPGGPNTLSARAVTMGELFKSAGYATAIFGKWHLGKDPHSLPTTHGFDEYYGIPPDMTWDSATYVDKIELTHSLSAPRDVLLARGPQIVEAVAGGELHNVKPFTPEVRAEIDNELVAKSIDFMRRQTTARKPFFLYLPFSMGHIPNLPSSQFKGKSRIGNYGDKLMEGDYHVGQILDAIVDLGIEQNTVVVFSSDNGPEFRRPWQGTAGFWRGTYHTALEGSLRAPFIIRWPGKIHPGVSNDIVHAVDMFTTLAKLGGAEIPKDRPIDGIDQMDFFLGKQAASGREGFLVYIYSELYAVKWRNWKYHLIWLDDMAKTPAQLPVPYLFNLL